MSVERSTRLIKLLLPTDLVRKMDAAILTSQGGYQDRNEFVGEAITDRLTEEAALHADPRTTTAEEKWADKAIGYVATQGPPAPVPRPGMPAIDPSRDGQLYLGQWRARDRGERCTVPARRSDDVSFGLHNRDFPTLWALDVLANMAGQGAVGWNQFTAMARRDGAVVGERLRLHDLAYGTAISVGIGFPKPGAKREASLDRFVNAMIGSARRADGPMFTLALIGFADAERETVAPTDAGVTALGDMLEGGLGTNLPQPQPVFERWWQHVTEWAPTERAAWLKVLHVISEAPSRNELLTRFPEWPGHIATTNTVGFIARSREWGLMQPELLNGRYQLTDLGEAVAREG